MMETIRKREGEIMLALRTIFALAVGILLGIVMMNLAAKYKPTNTKKEDSIEE